MKEQSKFGKIWKQYRALIIAVLAMSGVAAPVATGVISLGDAVAEVQADG